MCTTHPTRADFFLNPATVVAARGLKDRVKYFEASDSKESARRGGLRCFFLCVELDISNAWRRSYLGSSNCHTCNEECSLSLVKSDRSTFKATALRMPVSNIFIIIWRSVRRTGSLVAHDVEVWNFSYNRIAYSPSEPPWVDKIMAFTQT